MEYWEDWELSLNSKETIRRRGIRKDKDLERTGKLKGQKKKT